MSQDYSPFYPPVQPYGQGRLKVSSLHELAYELVGTAGGKPAVYLHGGPGAGISPVYRQAFDPRRYQVVLFDQRGCGKSTPYGELKENTTWDLVEDLEKLRKHLSIDRWQVVGGSWGGTLALAYAQSYPHRVTEMIIRGPCLWTRRELDWMHKDGASRLFPEAWEAFVSHIPEQERDDLEKAYYRRLCSKHKDQRQAAAKAWGAWESALLSLVPDPELIAGLAPCYMGHLALFECHYMVNGGWLDNDTQLFDNSIGLRHIPCVMIFGRYDVITPPDIGWRLKRIWPEMELMVVPDAGHAFTDPGIAKAIVEATDRFAIDHDQQSLERKVT